MSVGESITTGVVGSPHRSSVSSWGAVTPHLPTGAARCQLDWHVAADDRWHVPRTEPTLRQRRVAGTAVVETRIRIPDGDAVQRVYGVADHGGLTVVDVENDSPAAIAVALSGCPVLTERPPSEVPVRGIELPEDAIVLPIGHRARVRVAIPHGRPISATTDGLAAVADVDSVVRGWLLITRRAGHLVLPEPMIDENLAAARCDLLLEGPIDVGRDPGGFVLDVAELVRCGEDAERWLPEIVGPVEERIRRSRGADGELDGMLDAVELVAHAADDRRAMDDVARIRSMRARTPGGVASLDEVSRTDSVGRFVRDVQRFFAADGRLLPLGVPANWVGADFEVHDLADGGSSTVSYAIRWHGERPAVLWEQSGPVRTLSAPVVAPAWSTSSRSGEALWPAPHETPNADSTDEVSFG